MGSQKDAFIEWQNQDECNRCKNKEELCEYCTRNGGKQGHFLDLEVI